VCVCVCLCVCVCVWVRTGQPRIKWTTLRLTADLLHVLSHWWRCFLGSFVFCVSACVEPSGPPYIHVVGVVLVQAIIYSLKWSRHKTLHHSSVKPGLNMNLIFLTATSRIEGFLNGVWSAHYSTPLWVITPVMRWTDKHELHKLHLKKAVVKNPRL